MRSPSQTKKRTVSRDKKFLCRAAGQGSISFQYISRLDSSSMHCPSRCVPTGPLSKTHQVFRTALLRNRQRDYFRQKPVTLDTRKPHICSSFLPSGYCEETPSPGDIRPPPKKKIGLRCFHTAFVFTQPCTMEAKSPAFPDAGYIARRRSPPAELRTALFRQRRSCVRSFFHGKPTTWVAIGYADGQSLMTTSWNGLPRCCIPGRGQSISSGPRPHKAKFMQADGTAPFCRKRCPSRNFFPLEKALSAPYRAESQEQSYPSNAIKKAFPGVPAGLAYPQKRERPMRKNGRQKQKNF